MAGGDAGPDVLARLRARRRRAWSAPAATPGARGWSACCAASASARSSCERPLRRASRAASSPGRRWRAPLVSRPDVLLLDEPTNHLDLEAVEWLERAIAELGAAVVLVSHDRWFLESRRHRRPRARPRPRRSSGRWATRPSGGSGPSPSTGRAPRPSARRPRSRASSASSPAGAPAPSRGRRPRARSGSTRSSGSRRPRGRPTSRSGSPRSERSGRVVLEVDGLGRRGARAARW